MKPFLAASCCILVFSHVLLAAAAQPNGRCGEVCMSRLEGLARQSAAMDASAVDRATRSLQRVSVQSATDEAVGNPPSDLELMLLQISENAEKIGHLGVALDSLVPSPASNGGASSLDTVNHLLDTAGVEVDDSLVEQVHKQTHLEIASDIDHALLTLPELHDAANGLSDTNGADGNNPAEPGLGKTPQRLAYGAVNAEKSMGSAQSTTEMLARETKHIMTIMKELRARIAWDNKTNKKLERTGRMMTEYQNNLLRAELAQRTILKKAKRYIVGMEGGLIYAKLLSKHLKSNRDYIVAIHEKLKPSDENNPDPDKSDEGKKKSLSETAAEAVAALNSLERLSEQVETSTFRHNLNIMAIYKKLLGIAKMMGKIHDAYEDVQYDHMFQDNLKMQMSANAETKKLDGSIKSSVDGAKEALDEDLGKMFKMMHKSITNTKVAEMQTMKKKVSSQMAALLKAQIERREHGLWLLGNTARSEARNQYNDMEKMLAYKNKMEKQQLEAARANSTLSDSMGLKIKFQQALHKAVDDAAEKEGAAAGVGSSPTADLTERVNAAMGVQKGKAGLHHQEMQCSCEQPDDRDLELADFQNGSAVRCQCRPVKLN